MLQHWDHIEELLEAREAGAVAEIGCARGATTARLIEWAWPRDVTIHAVDPAPRFTDDVKTAISEGRLFFHPSTSLECIPKLPALDAVLIDGDHNWYTVFNELTLLDEKANREERVFPLVFLHDVGWPYGRRDQYYEPERIPAEVRHTWSTGGLVKGRSEAVDGHGYSAGVKHASSEGGPRNGVLTAVEDFANATRRQMRYEEVVGFAGLGVLADSDALEAFPRVAAALDRLATAEFLLTQCRALDDAYCRLLARVANGHRRAVVEQRRRDRREQQIARAQARIAALEAQLELASSSHGSAEASGPRGGQ